jgi:hypothetical protein
MYDPISEALLQRIYLEHALPEWLSPPIFFLEFLVYKKHLLDAFPAAPGASQNETEITRSHYI